MVDFLLLQMSYVMIYRHEIVPAKGVGLYLSDPCLAKHAQRLLNTY